MTTLRVLENSSPTGGGSRLLSLVAGFILFLVLLVAFFAGSLFQFVPVDKIGVKKVEFGPGAGLVKTDFGPGYHFGPAFFCTWYLLPANVQSIDMLRTEPEVARDQGGLFKRVVVSNNDIKVKTTEGYDVSVDLSLKYRNKEGSGWRIIENFPDPHARRDILARLAKTSCNEVLGQLATEDFFNPTKRISMANILKERIAAEFDRRGMIIIDVLIRDFLFDPTYEEKIKDKKLADQDVELNKSMTQAAEFEGETRKVQAETQAEVTWILEDGAKSIRKLKAENDFEIRKIDSDADKKVVEIRSDADLYHETIRAQAQLLVKNAEAQVTRLRTTSMEARGAENYVAMEMIRNLNFSDFKVSTQRFNPLEVEKVLSGLFGN